LKDIYDLAVIGGGINGCGIARDAAGRGLSVYLCEQDDLASGTSSWSTKLIHGGLRYLEYYEFRLVREALIEREVLWAIAPHIIRPVRFVLPHHDGLRPAWLLRLGLFLYDHIGGRHRLPATRTLDLRRDPAGVPLKDGYATAFEYSDCAVDDARLVVLNALDAERQGAAIRTRTRCVKAERQGDHWLLVTQDRDSGQRQEVRARALVNAAGPWVANVLSGVLGHAEHAHVRLVQGSHIVVRRLYEHDRCYIFQNADGRIIFAIPYRNDFTLIGTTDRDYEGDPAAVTATDGEIDYLCAAASAYFRQPVRRDDVVWTYSGVRPLYDDGASSAQAATRDYVLELEAAGGAPLLSIFGGKITTYRRLAEAALEKLAPFLPDFVRRKAGWTGHAPLPGGEFAMGGFDRQVAELVRQHPFLSRAHATRLVGAYGTQAHVLLGEAKTAGELGADFGHTLSEAEVRYLMRKEWARTTEDILWRRSKLGLHFTPEQTGHLSAWLAAATTT